MDYGLDPIELESAPAPVGAPEPPSASEVEAAHEGSLPEDEPLEVELGEKYGAAWFTQATAITNAEAMASQQANVGGSAALSSISTGELHRIRTDYLDTYQSRWSRDPGRANGPYS